MAIERQDQQAPRLVLGGQGGGGRVRINRANIVNTAPDWDRVANFVSSQLGSAAQSFDNVREREEHKTLVRANLDGVLGRAAAEEGNDVYMRGYKQGSTAAAIRKFGSDTLDYFESEEGMALDEKQATSYIDNQYVGLRKQYEDAGDDLSMDVLDSYMVELTPRLGQAHAKARKGYLRREGKRTVGIQMQEDVRAMSSGMMTTEQFVSRWQDLGKNGYLNLNREDIDEALSTAAIEGLNLGDPSILKAIKMLPDEHGQTLYDHGPNSKAIQTAEAAMLRKTQAALTVEQVKVKNGLNEMAENAQLPSVEVVLNTLREAGIPPQMEYVTGLFTKQRKAADGANRSASLMAAANTGDILAVPWVKTSEINSTMDAIVTSLADGSDAEPDAVFRAQLDVMGRNGAVSPALSRQLVGKMRTMPENVTDPAPELEEAVGMYEVCRRSGFTMTSELFGGDDNVARMESIFSMMEGGMTVQQAAKLQRQIEENPISAAERSQAWRDTDVRGWLEDNVMDTGWFDEDPDGLLMEQEQRTYSMLARKFFAAGVATTPDAALATAHEHLKSRREMVNGRWIYRPAGTPSLRERMGYADRNKPVDEVVAEFAQDKLGAFWPGEEDIDLEEDVALRLTPDGLGVTFVLDRDDMELPGPTFTIAELSAGQKIAEQAARAQAVLADEDTRNEEFVRQDMLITQSLSGNAQMFKRDNPEFAMFTRETWDSLTRDQKSSIIWNWQIRTHNDLIRDLKHPFEEFFGMEKTPLRSTSEVRLKAVPIVAPRVNEAGVPVEGDAMQEPEKTSDVLGDILSAIGPKSAMAMGSSPQAAPREAEMQEQYIHNIAQHIVEAADNEDYRDELYVPGGPKSGVTLGGGVDVGHRKAEDLIKVGVPASVANKLKPFYGLRGDAATEKLAKLGQKLSPQEVRLISNTVYQASTQAFAKKWADKTGAPVFFWPEDVQTAAYMLYHQYGDKFWEQNAFQQMADRDYKSLLKNFSNWGDKSGGAGSRTAMSINNRYARVGRWLQATMKQKGLY